jgi:hypothetical protein
MWHTLGPLQLSAAPHLLRAGDPLQLVAGPHTKDGAHREVGVHNGGAVQGVKGHAVALAAHIHRLWHLLAASVLAHMLNRKT